MEIALEYTLEQVDEIAEKLLQHAHNPTIMLFYGEMGAGKTTFIKAFCKALKVKENVSSPTFSIVNEYDSEVYGRIYHFDLYRLHSESEAENLGLSEYLDSGNKCLIEWPEKAPKLLNDRKTIDFHLRHINPQTRKIILST